MTNPLDLSESSKSSKSISISNFGIKIKHTENDIPGPNHYSPKPILK